MDYLTIQSLAKMRGSPAVLEWRFPNLPANTHIQVHYEFLKTFLSFEEFPSDPSRGFDVPPALVTISHPSTPSYTLYSDPLLVTLPLPDFSMPFNVITLTCTAMAFFFSSILNFQIRIRARKTSVTLLSKAHSLLEWLKHFKWGVIEPVPSSWMSSFEPCTVVETGQEAWRTKGDASALEYVFKGEVLDTWDVDEDQPKDETIDKTKNTPFLPQHMDETDDSRPSWMSRFQPQ